MKPTRPPCVQARLVALAADRPGHPPDHPQPMNESSDMNICLRLCRWEQSAANTYAHAIELFRDGAVRPILEEVRADHLENARQWGEHLARAGGSHPSGEGMACWSGFLASVEGSAKLFGERSALVALLQGEEAGRADYDGALGLDGLLAGSRELIEAVFLPRLQRHVRTLRGLTAMR